MVVVAEKEGARDQRSGSGRGGVGRGAGNGSVAEANRDQVNRNSARLEAFAEQIKPPELSAFLVEAR